MRHRPAGRLETNRTDELQTPHLRACRTNHGMGLIDYYATIDRSNGVPLREAMYRVKRATLESAWIASASTPSTPRLLLTFA
ncbi:hypothetical protein [Actinoplanes sp. NPDC026619]|uniref:hypothetical protein n=1 Tax=Actinoplanes sp. NPDC026619 TaxID=3155798 RepID=UPI0033D59BFE